MKTQYIIVGFVLLAYLLGCRMSDKQPGVNLQGSKTIQASPSGKEDSMTVENIHWLGQSSIRIEDAGKQIYIDPFRLPDGLPKADYIFITHAHHDHFSPDDIAKIQKEGTVFVAPADIAKELKGAVRLVAPDQTFAIDTLKVTTVPAYNLTKKFHPRSNGWVGYIIVLSNGERVYHAGDTDFIPEMKLVKTDIALLPCGGTYTMDAKEAAEAANAIQPKILIPMHFGGIVGSQSDAETVKKLFKGETVVKAVEK
jgi:L-ascorbate metabolism protein UlaG (beta-lactamase superfamily)